MIMRRQSKTGKNYLESLECAMKDKYERFQSFMKIVKAASEKHEEQQRIVDAMDKEDPRYKEAASAAITSYKEDYLFRLVAEARLEELQDYLKEFKKAWREEV